MKKYNYINKSILSLLLTVTLSSCSDFLDIVPLNEVVRQNYWTEKADVTSAVNGCYAALETPDCISRMFVWGEVRSDNILTGNNPSWELRQVLTESILPTNSYASWECFYQVINRCNVVLHYAPQVSEIDPNYPESELNATIAEMKTLRALCYFYLIRTFRDVPYVTKPSLDDSNIEEDFIKPATSFNEILNNLILDLEEIQDYAPKLYPTTNENTSRVTRCLIYTLLADLYLWKDDYNQCVFYCNKVFDYKMDRYDEQKELYGSMLDIRLFKDEFPLIEECPSSSVNYGNAYTSIFGDGNSFESIFELYFERNQSVQNTLISNFFGSSSSRVGYVSADERLYQDAYSGNNDIFRYTDCRYLEGIYDNTNNFGIQKYTCDRIIIPEIVQNKKPSVSASVRNTNYANWIIYRLTDVMLMKAEAQALLVQKGMNDLNDSIKNENSVGAFKLVSCVFNRANNLNDMSKDTLVYDDYTNAMEDLVLTERRRELLFEGKRWFDLVRQAKRNQSTSSLVNTVIPKFKTNANVIRIKLASMDAIYFPYSESELKANPLLVQNPAYQTSETIEK